MAIKLNLDSSMILEKQFDGQLRGYNALQVDKFLDMIIKDYKIIEENYLIEKEKLDQLKKENTELQRELDVAKVENSKMQSKVGGIRDSNSVSYAAGLLEYLGSGTQISLRDGLLAYRFYGAGQDIL